TTAGCSCRSRRSSRGRIMRWLRSAWALLPRSSTGPARAADRWRPAQQTRGQMATGQQAPVLWVTLGFVIALPLAVLALAGFPIAFNYPEAGRFNIRGGMELLPEFMALLFGLSIYTAAFIAEVVRAGILAVAKGQTEAAYSLGLGSRPARRRGGTGRGALFAGPAVRPAAPPRGDPSGVAGDHSAAAQPVSQPDQEFH